jgi:hypothetical protein
MPSIKPVKTGVAEALRNRPRLMKVTPVKGVDMFLSVNIHRGDPIVLVVGVLVAKPLHVIPELPVLVLETPVELRVDDLLDFKVAFTVNDLYSARRFLGVRRKRIGEVRLEL